MLKLLSTPRLLVLCYHSISEETEAPIIGKFTVSPEVFEKQIAFFKNRNYHFITPPEFYSFLQGRVKLPTESVLLTFDDCYEDLYIHAYPILNRNNIRPICFLVSGLVGALNDWDIKNGAPPKPLLKIEQLKFLKQKGYSFESHSSSHLMYGITKKNGTQVIKTIKQEFKVLGLKCPTLFAYPYGGYNEVMKEELQEGGFQAAFTIDPGLVFQNIDHFQLPRIMLNQTDVGLKLYLKFLVYTSISRFKVLFLKR